MNYKFLKAFPVVGSEEYKQFRIFLKVNGLFSSRMRITTLKEEYLIEYWEDFLKTNHN